MPRNENKYWTAKQIKIIRSLYSDRNYSIEDIAEKIGKTVFAIRMKASDLNLRKIPPLFNESGNRWCNKCREYKNPSLFSKCRGNRQCHCRDCEKKHRDENKERFKANHKRYRDSEKGRSTKKKYNQKNKLQNDNFKRNYRYKNEYGITLDEYKKINESQSGVCAICKEKESYKDKRLSVDHDHISGQVRGLLCQRCNLMIGAAFDNEEILQSAISYLKRYKMKVKIG